MNRVDFREVGYHLFQCDRQGAVQAVVAHDTALRLCRLSELMLARVQLTVPTGFRKKTSQGVVLHKANLAEGDVRRQGSYRVTTPLGILLDLAASDMSPEHLEQAGEKLLLAPRRRLERGSSRRHDLQGALSAGRQPTASIARLALEAVWP